MSVPHEKTVWLGVFIVLVMSCSLQHMIAGEVQVLESSDPGRKPALVKGTGANPLQYIPEDVEVFFSCNITWLRSSLISMLEEADKGAEPDLKKGMEEIIATFHQNYYQGRHKAENRVCGEHLKIAQAVLAEAGFSKYLAPSEEEISGVFAKAAEEQSSRSQIRCSGDGQYIWDEKAAELLCSVHGSGTSPLKLPPLPTVPSLKKAADVLRHSPLKYGLMIDRVYLFSGGSSCTEGAVLATGTFEPEKVGDYMSLNSKRTGAPPPRIKREPGRVSFINSTVGGEGKVVLFGNEFILGGKPDGVDELMARDFRSLTGTPDRFSDVLSLASDEMCALAGKVYLPPGLAPAPLMISEWPNWIRFELFEHRLNLVAWFKNGQAASGLKSMVEMLRVQGIMVLGTKIGELEKNPPKPVKGSLAVPNPAVLKRLKETLETSEIKIDNQTLSIAIPLGELEENLRFLIKSGAAEKIKIPPGMKGLPSLPGLK